jgi:hypothetical protein
MRFPEAPQNPVSVKDLTRAIAIIQTTQIFCLNRVTDLPSNPYPDQILVHLDSGTPKIKWWNGAAWKTVTVT